MGGNGSGKTTLLNIIAEKLNLSRGAYFNRSAFFGDYISGCEYFLPRYAASIPEESRIITSDDIFDYLLDEPENSPAVGLQLELCRFLEDSARHFHCQFIIATHSPFLLAMKGAKIYDLDETPVSEKRWTELSNVRLQFDFFQKHAGDFLR